MWEKSLRKVAWAGETARFAQRCFSTGSIPVADGFRYPAAVPDWHPRGTRCEVACEYAPIATPKKA